MRLYGKKLLRSRIDKRVESKRETRDAIVWDVLTDSQDRFCRVKIQGTSTLVKAYYPFNWGNQPEWVKPGNAVQVRHSGGIRGRIEVVGHAQLVPTPVSGSSTPTAGTPPDAVLTGLNVHEMANASTMEVYVDAGTYRIDGVTYSSSAVIMSADSTATMGNNVVMGGGASAVITLNAAPSIGYFRIDLISIGTDGIIDYTAGVPVTANPLEPTLEVNHVKLDHILVYGGMTVVTYPYIGAAWTAAFLSTVRASISDEDLDWMSESTAIVTINAYDQYGNPFSRSIANGGLLFVMEFTSGSGVLSNSVSATRSEYRTSQSFANFTYTRDNNSADVSPFFTCSVEDNYTVYSFENIFASLYDSTGDYMN